MTLPVPPHLAQLARSFLAEEVRAEVRHATRNRLGAIRNAAFYLKRQVDTKTDLFQSVPRVPRFFELIEAEIESASAYLTGELPPEAEDPAPAALDVVLDRLRGSVQLPAGTRFSRTGSTGLAARMDAAELELAVFLLLENAADAPGVQAVSVELGADDEALRLAVADDGDGFSPEALQRGCEAFFTTRSGCQGLGLAVVRRIVERRWGGRVTLANAEGSGARVQLSLPHATWSGSASGRVLFVEDNEVNRLTLGTLLEEEGFEVVEAGSLAEAHSALEGQFALAILDVHLGDGEGTSLIPALRERTPSPVVVVLSGQTRAEVPGADLVLTKAQDPAGMLTAIRGALGAGGGA